MQLLINLEKMDGLFWSLVLEFGSFFALFQTRFGPLQES